MSGDSTTLLQITARYRRTNYGRKKKRPRISPGPILHKAKGLRLGFVFLLDDFFAGFLIDRSRSGIATMPRLFTHVMCGPVTPMCAERILVPLERSACSIDVRIDSDASRRFSTMP